MRITAPGLRPRGIPVSFSFAGRLVDAEAGDTLAAALVHAGELGWRHTASGGMRGLFCGMGVCHDCVLLVDGRPLRACMTAARDGMTTEALPAASLPEAKAPSLESSVREPDVLVVGAGPAGLAAAAAAAAAGARVTLVDERAKPGGQYYKQPSDAFEVDEEALDAQYRAGRTLLRRVRDAGVELLDGVQVWAASGPRELLAVGGGASHLLRPRRLVLATGAYERGVPVPGWTLPGFMTTGAAQTLMRAYQVLPGRRVLVSGNGPLNVQVAAELVRAGAEVVALCELAPISDARRLPALLRMAVKAPDLAVTGAGYLRTLRSARVPALYRHAVLRAEGDGRVERAVVARLDARGEPVAGSERSYPVDAVCVGFGFLPSNELARALGVEHVFDPALGQLRAVRSESGRTSVEDVWVVGDGGGTGGARLAQAEGTLAGLEAARTLGLVIPDAVGREGRAARRARSRNAAFQRALQQVYAAPRLLDQLAAPDTVVCRCEEVTLAAVDEALASGIESIGAVKRLTRAGMGRCQGRYCAPLLAELVGRRTGKTPDESAWFAPAPPFKPLPLALVTAAAGAALGRPEPGP